jgi:hypothetical protein
MARAKQFRFVSGNTPTGLGGSFIGRLYSGAASELWDKARDLREFPEASKDKLKLEE